MTTPSSPSVDSRDELRDAAGQDNASQQASASTGETLRTELSNLKSDLDALMERASNLSDEELRDARDKLVAQFSSMRHAAKNAASEANRHLNNGVEATTDYVKEKPLQSMAIATGLGLLIGSVLRR